MTEASSDEERLGIGLGRKIRGFEGPISLAKFPGGQSNPTYALDTRNGRYVLRRKPSGPLLASAHAVDREFRLISALHPIGFPVPRPLALCEDPSIIGSAFYVMDRVDGRTCWNGALVNVPPEGSVAKLLPLARAGWEQARLAGARA